MASLSRSIVFSLVLVFSISGCGKETASGNPTFQVSGISKLVMGASTVTTLMSEAVRMNPALTEGNWLFSPDKAKISFTGIDFVKSNGTSDSALFSDCTVTYDRSKASGSQLLSCPMSWNVTSDDATPTTGTYVGAMINFKPTISILINDSGNGIYTDPAAPTLLKTTLGTGADFVPYVIGNGSSSYYSAQVYFPAAVQIKADSSPEISIVTDMIHTIPGAVSGGVPSFQANTGNPPVQLMALANATGSSEFYSDGAAVSSIAGDETFVRVFYSGADPVYVVTSPWISGCLNGSSPQQAYAVDPATAPPQNAAGWHAGGYLGKDSNGVISWVFATDWLWTTYTGLYELNRPAAIGDTATFKCQALTSVPKPASGSTYASGAPSIAATTTKSLKLLAK